MVDGRTGRSGRSGQAAKNRVQYSSTGQGHVQTLPRCMAETAVKELSKNIQGVRQTTAQ